MDKDSVVQRRIAIVAETLYLLNLMILPGLAFILLTILFFKYRRSESVVIFSHLRQTMGLSVIGGFSVIATFSFVALFGNTSADTAMKWMWFVLGFTVIHSSLILTGVYGLVKALNDQPFVFGFLNRKKER
ncbi:MAG: hypothetical protein KDI36_08880 [Pseudomonadales bacterium]|nr:hypothetical protein [Pseudomonadales bacterium]